MGSEMCIRDRHYFFCDLLRFSHVILRCAHPLLYFCLVRSPLCSASHGIFSVCLDGVPCGLLSCRLAVICLVVPGFFLPGIVPRVLPACCPVAPGSNHDAARLKRRCSQVVRALSIFARGLSRCSVFSHVVFAWPCPVGSTDVGLLCA